MKILVVDDMPLIRHVLINMLRKLQFDDLVEATDGVQAFTLLHQQHFDLVITDLYMPKMDGKVLLKRIRDDEKLASLPVLIVTCEDSCEAVKEIIATKVSGFIIKPFNLKVLSDHLNLIIADANKK
ncbi:response regulator [Pseudoalteromonas sp. S558]|uniref:response regulator n=1 Tax=Pseudoalteromonas sp. S558 TaxID=2066515 RepID=UPI00110B19D0|nr:response regulator [Pseudoalteromonas sp. S558]TMO03657.1 two-component system response regulator [Pseudoalteromonas sp. S558]